MEERQENAFLACSLGRRQFLRALMDTEMLADEPLGRFLGEEPLTEEEIKIMDKVIRVLVSDYPQAMTP